MDDAYKTRVEVVDKLLGHLFVFSREWQLEILGSAGIQKYNDIPSNTLLEFRQDALMVGMKLCQPGKKDYDLLMQIEKVAREAVASQDFEKGFEDNLFSFGSEHFDPQYKTQEDLVRWKATENLKHPEEVYKWKTEYAQAKASKDLSLYADWIEATFERYVKVRKDAMEKPKASQFAHGGPNTSSQNIVSNGTCVVATGYDRHLATFELDSSSPIIAVADKGIAFWNVARSDPRDRDNIPGTRGFFEEVGVEATLFYVVFGAQAKNGPTFTTVNIEGYLHELNADATILWYKDGCYNTVTVDTQGRIGLSVPRPGSNSSSPLHAVATGGGTGDQIAVMSPIDSTWAYLLDDPVSFLSKNMVRVTGMSWSGVVKKAYLFGKISAGYYGFNTKYPPMIEKKDIQNKVVNVPMITEEWEGYLYHKLPEPTELKQDSTVKVIVTAQLSGCTVGIARDGTSMFHLQPPYGTETDALSGDTKKKKQVLTAEEFEAALRSKYEKKTNFHFFGPTNYRSGKNYNCTVIGVLGKKGSFRFFAQRLEFKNAWARADEPLIEIKYWE